MLNKLMETFWDEDKAFEYIANKRKKICICGKSKFYRVKGTKMMACSCGKQYSPLKGTIFEKSSTPLRYWLYAMFLFSTSKHGVSGAELQRQLGVTRKTAWRMCHKIRGLMKNRVRMKGIVEIDETYIGGRMRNGQGGRGKEVVLGAVKRGGEIAVQHVPDRYAHTVLNFVRKNVKKGSYLMTDQYNVYDKTKKLGYSHGSINHRTRQYAKGNIHTNTIEGFWRQFKTSMRGTHHSVSPKYLQNYLDEFAFRYSHRKAKNLFEILMRRV